MNIIDKRRNEGWNITIFCTPRSVIVQIGTSDDFESEPKVNIAISDFESAVKFARKVCQQTKCLVDSAADSVDNWFEMSPDKFLALLCEPLRM